MGQRWVLSKCAGHVTSQISACALVRACTPRLSQQWEREPCLRHVRRVRRAPPRRSRAAGWSGSPRPACVARWRRGGPAGPCCSEARTSRKLGFPIQSCAQAALRAYALGLLSKLISPFHRRLSVFLAAQCTSGVPGHPFGLCFSGACSIESTPRVSFFPGLVPSCVIRGEQLVQMVCMPDRRKQMKKRRADERAAAGSTTSCTRWRT